MHAAPITWSILVPFMIGGLIAAELPSIGAADFLPSPERPIGIRGDGNGTYPGARPVSEWSQTENLLWRMPVANYGNSSPLVVGDRVFVVSEPGWQSDCPTLACFDLATGAQHWISDVDQFSELPTADRDDARARRKKYYEILRASNRLGFQASQATDAADKQRIIQEIKEASGGTLQDMAARIAGHGLRLARSDGLQLTQKYQFNAPGWWYPDIGMVYATPCSDGQRVYVATAYDSLHAFDRDGKQVWQEWHRDGFGNDRKAAFPGDIRFTDSPLLVDGVLVWYANYRVRAYDPATGAVTWQTDGLRPAKGHTCGQMGVVRIPAAHGRPGFTALITYSGELLRLSDGAVLKRGLCTANFITIVSDGADTVFVVHSPKEAKDAVVDPAIDGPGLLALRIGQAADGAVTVTRRWRLENARDFADHGHAPVYHDGVLYGGQHRLHAIDAATGAVLWTASTSPTAGGAKPYDGPVKVGGVGGGFESAGWSLGGDLLVAQFCHGYAVAIDVHGERRSSTFLPPIPDPAGPKRDQLIAMTGSDRYSLWYGWNFGRSFATFAGRRTLVRSFEWLYCFGPAVEGTAGEDLGKLAAIRAETDARKLESHLADQSAQVRFEALDRLPAPVASAGLIRLLREDPCAENRAAAFRALGAEAGWQAIAAMIPEAMASSPPVFSAAEATVLRQDLVHLFRALGEEGRTVINREWVATKEPLTKRFLLHLAHSLAWRSEPILAEAILAMEKTRSEMPHWHVPVPNNRTLLLVLPEYLNRLDAARDPVMARRMLKAFPKDWSLYSTFARNLEPEALLAWIEPLALESSHPMRRTAILDAWNAVGAAARPSMQRVKAAMLAKGEADKLATEYAQAIEAALVALESRP